MTLILKKSTHAIISKNWGFTPKFLMSNFGYKLLVQSIFLPWLAYTYQKTRKTLFRIDLVDRFVKFSIFHILSNFRNYFLSKKCMGVQFSYTPCDFVVLKATQNLVPNLCQRALTFFKNFMFYPKI